MDIEKYRALVSEDTKTMRSTDLHSFVYEATGKYKEPNSFNKVMLKAIADVETVTEYTSKMEGSEISGFTNDVVYTANKKISHIDLTEVECNMIMATIDVNHLRLMAKVFVVVKNSKQYQPQFDSQELAQTVATAVVQAMVQVIPMMSQQETELDKQKKQLEIDKLQMEKIMMVADLSEKYKLETIGDVTHVTSELKRDMKELTGSVVKEVRPAVNGVSPTSALSAIGESVRVKDFYKAMNNCGLTSYHEEPRYLGGVTLTHEIIGDGRYYGYNQHSSSIRKYPVQCKFYSDRFEELLKFLRAKGHLI